MGERRFTITSILLLIQAIIVVGGGFYLFGGLGNEVRNLSLSIDRLAKTTDIRYWDHETRIRNAEKGK